MARPVRRRLASAALEDVTIADAFWAPRVHSNSSATIPHIHRQLQKTGRLDAWKLKGGAGRRLRSWPQFWDSDVAKWMEAAAYGLAAKRNTGLEGRLDDLIALIARAQQKDGYVNTYFTAVEPGKRWANLRDMHELYCAGHLMEAAVAYYETTGKREFLDVMCRCADHIGSVFGPARGQKRGYPGHEEIELALVKLYRATGEKRYLDLAAFFIDERGRTPHYFDLEAGARGEEPRGAPYDYWQAHLPVREQSTAEGHSVRAMYLYSGMADLAAETGDAALLSACRRIWRNTTRRRMYVTGGLGSTSHGERFTFDYDLPNETAYSETCAAIALVFWAHRMLEIEDDGDYADIMERALYNGVISGISLDGKHFFYSNPLTVYPRPDGAPSGPFPPMRQPWFDCACCPPNISRLLASLGHYIYSQRDGQLSVHLYVQGSARLNTSGSEVVVTQETGYPWEETVRITVEPESPASFTLALRIPAWCRSARLRVNARPVGLDRLVRRGYARIKRTWEPGDTVDLTLPMPVERIEAHPRVRMNAGRVALQRGPIVYCLEETDNGRDLSDLALPREAALHATFDKALLNGSVVIEAKGRRRPSAGWANALHRPGRTGTTTAKLKAVPYGLWCNRRPGEMLVWIRDA